MLTLGTVLAQEKYESELVSKFNKGVHIVAQVSDSNIKLKDSLIITYKLYVSQDIGVSNYSLSDQIENINYVIEDVSSSNIKIEYEIFKNENYRFVVLKKSILKPKLKGKFELEGLALDITAEIPSKENDQFGRRIMEKVTRTIKTKNLTINVI